ncbi:sensor histidine kinase [Saccharothrix variisporea]|uniref:sensor histidine kinase n=1 Tax=Saccharothrix variisporea TaxID=543527 RepID=UPI0014775EF4|nr:histidine kinase [Saccharothrix variisporea]
MYRSVAVDAGVAALAVTVFWLPSTGPVEPALIALFVVGVLLRSWWPVTAFGVTSAATLAGAILGVAQDPFTAAAWVLYRVAATRDGPVKVVSAALGTAVVVLVAVGTPDGAGVARYAAVSVLVTVGAWRLGTAVRREREEALRVARAEREQAVLAERLRVVREVHDVVSHSLGTIAVTAGVTAHVAGDDADRLRRGLARVEETGRQALDELRTVLHTVRSGALDLGPVVERARAAGIEVDVDVDTSVPLTPAVYRIVQEGLTNVVRHAPGARCEVVVRRTLAGVEVVISDDGPGVASEPSPGHGLVGLRERVESLGGSVEAGPGGGGGFVVRAVVPEVGDG